MASTFADVNFDRCALAVEGDTPASTASSVAVNARPDIRDFSMRARAGSPISAATLARSPPLPRIRNALSAFVVVDDQDQVVIVIAVLHFDVDAGIGHE